MEFEVMRFDCTYVDTVQVYTKDFYIYVYSSQAYIKDYYIWLHFTDFYMWLQDGKEHPSRTVLENIVQHFQTLFDVPSVSGVFPRMNDIYTKLGEVHNVLNTLRNLLGLCKATYIAQYRYKPSGTL
jgi:hypothetical protein